MMTRITTVTLLLFLFSQCSAQRGRPATLVKTARVQQRQIAEQMTFVGSVEPARVSAVGSAVDGRVDQFNLEEGQQVKAGQPLAELLKTTISLEIAAAAADLKLREEELNEHLAGSREEEIRQAQAQKESAGALLKYATAKFKRLEKLFNEGRVVNQEELDESLFQKVAAERGLEATNAALDLARAGPRKEVIAQARARVENAKQTLNRLQEMRNKYTIRAPFDGFITLKQAEKGDWVSRGDDIAEVMELTEVDITVQIPEAYISQVRVQPQLKASDSKSNTNVFVKLDAIPRGDFQGYVRRIVPRADIKTRAFPVKIRVENRETEDRQGVVLKPGMLARVMLPVGSLRPARVVPKDAIVLGGRSPSIFIVKRGEDQTTVVAIPVKLGATDGEFVEFVELDNTGELIKVGAEVVVEGNERLRPGGSVRVLGDAAKSKE